MRQAQREQISRRRGSADVPVVRSNGPTMLVRRDRSRRYGGDLLVELGKEITLIDHRRGTRRRMADGMPQVQKDPWRYFDGAVGTFFDDRAHLPPEERTIEEAIRYGLKRTEEYYAKYPEYAPGYDHSWLKNSYYWAEYQKMRAERGLPPGPPPDRPEAGSTKESNMEQPQNFPRAMRGPSGVLVSPLGQTVEDAAAEADGRRKGSGQAPGVISYRSCDGNTYSFDGLRKNARPTDYALFFSRVQLHMAAEEIKGGSKETVWAASQVLLKDRNGQVVLSADHFATEDEAGQEEAVDPSLAGEFGV